jgi:hypothetical protein
MQTRIRLCEVSVTRTSDGSASQEVGRPTNSTKYDTGECIAENELKNTCDEQQKTTKEDDRPTFLVNQMRILHRLVRLSLT